MLPSSSLGNKISKVSFKGYRGYKTITSQTVRNCHFNKMMEGPKTYFQSPALSQKYVRNVCHT